MTDAKTESSPPDHLSVVEIIERIDAMQNTCDHNVGSILPENFFSSIRHYLLELARIVKSAQGFPL